jgi:hypothetical protein
MYFLRLTRLHLVAPTRCEPEGLLQQTYFEKDRSCRSYGFLPQSCLWLALGPKRLPHTKTQDVARRYCSSRGIPEGGRPDELKDQAFNILDCYHFTVPWFQNSASFGKYAAAYRRTWLVADVPCLQPGQSRANHSSMSSAILVSSRLIASAKIAVGTTMRFF